MKLNRSLTSLSRHALPVLVLLSTRLAFAAEYYLSPSGNDSNSGTRSAPWKTLDRLERAQSALRPGDIVYFRGGNYVIDDSTPLPSGICGSSSPYLWKANGTAAARITYRNYLDESPVILYNRMRINCHAVAIRPMGNYLTIEGLTIRQTEASRRVALPDGLNPKEEPPTPTTAYPSYYRNSVRALALAGSDITLRKCTVDNFSSVGMSIKGANPLVEYCTFTNSGNHVWYLQGANGTYRYNLLDGSRQRPESGRYGIQIQYLQTHHNKLYGNVIQNIVAGGVIFSGRVSYNEVFNNIFINAGSGRTSGQVVGAWTEDGAVGQGNKFYNNTAIGKSNAMLIGGKLNQFAVIEVRNNIFYPSNRIPVGASFPTITNNIFFNISNAAPPPGNRLENPQLVHPLGSTPASAMLRANSSAINAATGTVPTHDFFQNPRRAPDIGAHEFGSGPSMVSKPRAPTSMRVR